MYQGIRTSSNRIRAVGKRNPDWTQQSTRFISPKTGEAKPIRRKCLRNQVLVDGLTVDLGATINKVEKVRVPVQLKNGSMGEREQTIGYYNGKRVYRDGYAYGFVKDGKTPGRWHYA